MADEKYLQEESSLQELDHGKGWSSEKIKLLVSFNDIVFSSFDNGYYEVSPGIYFSTLLYLLYVNDVKAGSDFERAKSKAKAVLIRDLEKKRESLIRSIQVAGLEASALRAAKLKVQLITKAISYLQDQ